MRRCNWANSSELMQEYHDNEWAVPSYDDQYLFEMLTLEIFQAGLSWNTILTRRENFRKAFNNFDIEEVKQFNEEKILELQNDAGIIRNKLKINATINNAQIISTMHQENKKFSDFIWSFTDKKRIINHYEDSEQLPAYSDLAVEICKSLKKLGFKFVGPTIVYSFMQAAGIINDHMDSCDFK